jgi:hypothetical protein
MAVNRPGPACRDTVGPFVILSTELDAGEWRTCAVHAVDLQL